VLIAAWSANAATLYYSASGAWAPSNCPKSEDPIPYCFEEWTPEVSGFSSHSMMPSMLSVKVFALTGSRTCCVEASNQRSGKRKRCVAAVQRQGT